MSYATVALIRRDRDLADRIAGCAAVEGIDDPEGWAMARAWRFAAQPGWAAAWESAVANGVAEPGRDETVVTDGMVLSAVRVIASGAQSS